MARNRGWDKWEKLICILWIGFWMSMVAMAPKAQSQVDRILIGQDSGNIAMIKYDRQPLTELGRDWVTGCALLAGYGIVWILAVAWHEKD